MNNLNEKSQVFEMLTSLIILVTSNHGCGIKWIL